MNLFVKAVFFFFAASGALAADLPIAPKPEPRPAREPAPKAEPQRAIPAPGKVLELKDLGENCTEATDGCRTFKRAGDGKFDATNNIGFACQPRPLTCTSRR